MTLPRPHPGLVIRYAYLWWQEHREGRQEGTKDRPCAVILALGESEGATEVTVAPITHTAPSDPAGAIEIPQTVKRRLGLDDGRSWIVVTEVNRFIWPGPDLRPVPGSRPLRFDHGYLPPRFFAHVRDRIAARVRAALMRSVRRDPDPPA